MTARCKATRKRREHLLPRVHRVIALLKRWLLGTHQGAIGQQHLDDYLDEFTFRFNRRTSKSRGKLVLSIGSASRADRPRPVRNLGQTTTCCIWWRQVNTPISLLRIAIAISVMVEPQYAANVSQINAPRPITFCICIRLMVASGKGAFSHVPVGLAQDAVVKGPAPKGEAALW